MCGRSLIEILCKIDCVDFDNPLETKQIKEGLENLLKLKNQLGKKIIMEKKLLIAS